MSNRHTNLQATNPAGQQLSVSHTTTDSPILPAANLEQLQHIDPTLVPWVVKQTETEAAHRRRETSKVNTFIFIERISGVIVGGLVAIAGLSAAAYIAIQGYEVAASIIGGATLLGIVSALVTRQSGQKQHPTPPAQSNKKKNRNK